MARHPNVVAGARTRPPLDENAYYSHLTHAKAEAARMRIELYTNSWNERRMLPFFLDHYESWVDRFIVFDDGSDDGTAEAWARHPKVDLRPYPPKGNSFVLTTLQIWQHVWKESRGRADWVIVTNVDEFLYHPDGMPAYLERCSADGVTMLHPYGFAMVGRSFPEGGKGLVSALRRGAPMYGHDKRQVFVPDAITEINFVAGRHRAHPTGVVREPRVPEAKLLHYKYVDPDGYLIPRQRALGARLLPGDVARGLGGQYASADAVHLDSFAWLEMHATDVVTPVDVEPSAAARAG